MKTRSQYQCEQLPVVGGYFVTRRSLYRPTRVKDSFLPSLHDPSHKYQIMEKPPLHDPSQKDQTMEEPPLHDKIEDGYASSSVSSVYSEELSSESDDGECTGQSASSSLDKVKSTPALAPFTSSYLTDDSEDYASDYEPEEPESAKPTANEWKMSWPKEGGKTESACVHVYGFYRKSTHCGGYAVILRNKSAHPIAARARVSQDGKSYFFQVLAGLAAGLRLAADHGCVRPLVRCNSSTAVKLFRQVAPCGCGCQGSCKKGNICHKCIRLYVPCLSDDCVPLFNKLREKLGSLDFDKVLRRSNKPAHYLAKQAKKDARVAFKNRRQVDYEASMKPVEFPDELVSFLLSDSDHSIYYH